MSKIEKAKQYASSFKGMSREEAKWPEPLEEEEHKEMQFRKCVNIFRNNCCKVGGQNNRCHIEAKKYCRIIYPTKKYGESLQNDFLS